MYTTIASFFLVLALMFGGSSAAVLAAQDSLPNQSLYQVKTLSEDLALRSTFRNTHRLQMELDYADRRVSEMIRLRERKQEIPEFTYLRLQNHLDQALMVAANSDEGEMVRVLNQVRERMQLQTGFLASKLDHDPLLLRTREMIQTRIGWAELGLDEPDQFRQQARLQTQFNQQARFEHQYGPGPGSGPDLGPGEGAFGPGPQDLAPKNDECQFEGCNPAPENGYGPGQEAQEKHQYGPGPENQPAEGSGNTAPGQPSSGAENPGPGPVSSQDQESGSDGQGSSSSSEPTGGNDSSKGHGGTP